MYQYLGQRQNNQKKNNANASLKHPDLFHLHITVLTTLTELLYMPQLECSIRSEIAEQYIKDTGTYEKYAEETCKQQSEVRF